MDSLNQTAEHARRADATALAAGLRSARADTRASFAAAEAAGALAPPCRDPAQPCFDGRPVLRGASRSKQPRLRHPKYRHCFTADRNDIAAGFRSCRP